MKMRQEELICLFHSLQKQYIYHFFRNQDSLSAEGNCKTSTPNFFQNNQFKNGIPLNMNGPHSFLFEYKKDKCIAIPAAATLSAINYEICENIKTYPLHRERIFNFFEACFIPCARKLIQNQSIQGCQPIPVLKIST